MDVASGLFATAGLRRTTMETIAAAAGRGRRTVYMYFKNKAEIYDAVVEAEIRHVTAPLAELVRADDSFGVILSRYGEERARSIGRLLGRNPLLMKDFALGHSRVEKLRDRLYKVESQILIPLFRKHSEVFRAAGNPSPEDWVSIFLSMLRGTDRLLTKTDGLNEAIRLSSVSAWLISSANGISS